MTSFDLVVRINQKMDQMGVPYEVNEHCIEAFLIELENSHKYATDGPFWLTMARIMELAILCAGHYADNCEFGAAGDLLLNPREITVKNEPKNIYFTKIRHGRLSHQLKFVSRSRKTSVTIKEVDCHIIRPALLPYLKDRLLQSDFFHQVYLDDIEQRMERIAATMGFMMAFQVNSFQELYLRMQGAKEDQQRFIKQNLCQFDHRHFERFGRQIKDLTIS